MIRLLVLSLERDALKISSASQLVVQLFPPPPISFFADNTSANFLTSIEKMSMYIRIKRRNQTMFLHTESSSNFADIKKKIAANFNMDSAHIMLLGSDKKKELVDLATISDQEIKNDEIIYMLFAKETGGWEDLQVEALLPFGEEASEHNNGTLGVSS